MGADRRPAGQLTVPFVPWVFAGLAVLYAFFWWQESRRPAARLSPRGRAARRLTVIFAAVGLFLAYMLR